MSAQKPFLIALLLLALALSACSNEIPEQLKVTVEEKVSQDDYLGFVVRVCPLENEKLYTDIALSFCLVPNPDWEEKAPEPARDPNNYINGNEWHVNAWANGVCSNPNLITYSWDNVGNGCQEVSIPRVISEYSTWSGEGFAVCPFSSIEFTGSTYVRNQNNESTPVSQKVQWVCNLNAVAENGMTGAVVGDEIQVERTPTQTATVFIPQPTQPPGTPTATQSPIEPTVQPSPTSPATQPTSPQGGIGMANPASVYCQEQGYRLEIREDAAGNQYGVCIFPDGSECEEWAFYNGQCAPGQGGVLAQRYVGAYMIGQYTRLSKPAEGNNNQATVRRIEKVVQALDDMTELVEVTYEGDGKDLIDVLGTWRYTVNLQTGQLTITEGASSYNNPQAWGTLTGKSGDALVYTVDYEEVVDGWKYHWFGTIRRHPQTYLLLFMEKNGDVSNEASGKYWGRFEDTVTLVEHHLP